jgi:hypothetical protein
MSAHFRGFVSGALVGLAVWMVAPTRLNADEIRLKDGKKLYGVIVAYEDNMFKVKTDFGYVLVEKDKIAAIIPTVPATPSVKPDPAGAKSEVAVKKPEPAKPETTRPASPASASAKPATSPTSPASAPAPKSPATAGTSSEAKAAGPTPAPNVGASQPAHKPANTPSVQPAPQKNPNSTDSRATKSPSTTIATGAALAKDPSKNTPSAWTAKSPATAPANPKGPDVTSIPVVTAIPPAKAKPAPPPPNREALEGNMYINYTHGFRMYKAPSWKLIEDARKSLPNAIVAMGTSNESTLMVVAEEKSKSNLEATAVEVESRLRDTYGNYRRISQSRTVAGGFPAVEIHYHGIADDHDWSGTLLVVSRSGDMFSILGMTYADTDLIQIQENVISRAIASLEFNAN